MVDRAHAQLLSIGQDVGGHVGLVSSHSEVRPIVLLRRARNHLHQGFVESLLCAACLGYSHFICSLHTGNIIVSDHLDRLMTNFMVKRLDPIRLVRVFANWTVIERPSCRVSGRSRFFIRRVLTRHHG